MTNHIVLRYCILFDVMRDIVTCNKCNNFNVRKKYIQVCIRIKYKI